MQLCIGSSLAIIVPTTIRSYITHRAMGVVIHQVVRLWSTARCSWRHPWVAGFGLGSGRPLQDFVCDFRGLCQREDVSWAELEPWRQLARATRATRFRVSDRTGFVSGWRKRWIDLQCGAYALRNTIHQAVATSAGIGVPITIVGTIGYVLAGWRLCRCCRRFLLASYL